MAHDLAARQRADIHLLPMGQALTRTIFIALFQRITDAGEMVAELAKPQGDIQHRHTPDHRKRPSQQQHQQPVNSEGDQRRYQHSQAPSHPAVVRLARVKVAAD